MTQGNPGPDLSKVTQITEKLSGENADSHLDAYLHEAREYLREYEWCKGIRKEYVGLFVDGIIGIFLFQILPSRPEVDEWIWVVVGDLPPTYLTCDRCPNPATALDGYIGAMSEWVEAASKGTSVAELVPVNVPATRENAALLKKRLDFLDQRILANYQNDLTGPG